MTLDSKTVSRFAHEFILPCGALLYFSGYFIGSQSQRDNLVFYWLCLLPSVIYFLANRTRFLLLFKSQLPFLALLTAMSASYLYHGRGAEIRYVIQIGLLFFVVGALAALPRPRLNWLFLLFSGTSVVALAYASWKWAASFMSAGAAARIVLSDDLSPLRTAPLIVMAICWVWVFVLAPALEKSGSAIRIVALLLLTSALLWCAVVFQARSVLLGIALFLALGILSRQIPLVSLVALAAISTMAIYLGWFDILAQRGTSYRLDIWSDGIGRALHECNAFLGCGKDGHKFHGHWSHIHSAYFDILYENGLIVFLLAMALLAVLIVYGVRYRSQWMLVASIGWGAVATTTGGVFMPPAAYWVFFWIPTFFAAIEIREKMSINSQTY